MVRVICECEVFDLILKIRLIFDGLEVVLDIKLIRIDIIFDFSY